MKYMIPEPKTNEQYFKDLKRSKPINKEILLKKALESSEYKKWKAAYYADIHKFFKELCNEK